MDELPRELPAKEGEGTEDGGPEDTTPVSPSSRITSGDWMVWKQENIDNKIFVLHS